MNIYVDVDKTLLTHELKPAKYLVEFLGFIIQNYSVYWFTSHCRNGKSSSVINYLSQFLDQETLELVKKIKATRWDFLKTEAVNFNREFLILDDYLMDAEIDTLKQHGKYQSWVRVTLREIPDQLLKIISVLDKIKKIETSGPELITFFHITDSKIDVFYPQEKKRPTFFWFSDRYHRHIGMSMRDRYFYLFVKNTKKDNIHFMPRIENGDFDSLYKHYLKYIRLGKFDDISPEPGILMSYDRIKPDLVAEFSNRTDKTCHVVLPEEFKGWELKLFDDQDVPVRFTEVPELIRILPNLPYSIPFSKPKLIGNKYSYTVSES